MITIQNLFNEKNIKLIIILIYLLCVGLVFYALFKVGFDINYLSDAEKIKSLYLRFSMDISSNFLFIIIYFLLFTFYFVYIFFRFSCNINRFNNYPF